MSSLRLTLPLALLLALASASTAAAAPGDLDPTFGTYGKYLSPVQGNTTADDVVVQPDGAVLVAGTSPDRHSTIFRFTPAGVPDPSFGANGRVVLPGFGDAAVALQGEKIVVAANERVGQEGHTFIYRLRSDGGLDATFGAGGAADTGLPASRPQLLITPGQAIVVSGSSFPIPGLIVARLLPDGQSFDPAFAGGVVYAEASPGASVEAMAAGPGEAVTILESTFSGPENGSRLLRYRADGSLDPDFAGGETKVLPGGTPAYLNDVALRPDGSLVAVGRRDTATSRGAVIAALTPAGLPDPGFGEDGAVDVEADGFGSLAAVGFDAQGRILATGSAVSTLRIPTLLLARYLPDGSPDSTFGVDGRASAVFRREMTVGRALATTADGRIVVAAERLTGFRSDHYVLGLMRFLVADGPRDPDADGVLAGRDRCPQLGGPRRYRGCPLIERRVELQVNERTVEGEVSAPDRACRGEGKAVITQARKGRDRVLVRRSITGLGNFKARFGPRFEGRVYARITAATDPLAGRCGPATSRTVSVG